MEVKDDLRQMLDPKSLILPSAPKVREIKVDAYEESSDGEDALWVKVILDEATGDSERSWDALEPIDEAIRRKLRDAKIDLFPYIEFVKQSELAA